MLTVPLGILIAILLPQPAPIDVGVNSGGSFAFDWSGNHSDGSSMAETTDVEFHFRPVPPVVIAGAGTGDGHVTIKLPLVAVVGENIVPMSTSLNGVPAGVYDLEIRLFGPGGNPSIYSSPVLALRVRVKNPDAPTNMRVVGEPG